MYVNRGKLIDLEASDPKYLLSDSDTDSSIDSDMSDVSANESGDDLEEIIDENVDDMELEEALSESPVAQMWEELDRGSVRNVINLFFGLRH